MTVKRYNVLSPTSAEESEAGEWVRWEDVQGLLDVTPNMVTIAENAFQDYVDSRPGPRKAWRVDVFTKFRIRYQAMLRFAMGLDGKRSMNGACDTYTMPEPEPPNHREGHILNSVDISTFKMVSIGKRNIG